MRINKNKWSVVALLFALSLSFGARADEGMWLLNFLKQINEGEMQEMGLKLTAEQIYSINNASLKDAIVRLNGGQCTGEVISSKGLILTNHHCAYNAVQGVSTDESNYLDNGFWAMSHEEEIPLPGFYISFLRRIDDVTADVLADVTDDMSEEDRQAAIQTAIGRIETEAGEGNELEIQVKSFYYGSEFYMMTYENYGDIRLAGVPPESIGKYGGDTDNWMWPRHTGDFSMLRVYGDEDNNPSDYSENNIPLTPKHHLPVSMDGVKPGDYSMIMGFPGSTDRFLSSYGVKQALDLHQPSVVEVRDLKLKTMKMHMDADPSVRLKYAAKYASTANYWKYYIGQQKGLKRLNVYGKKKELEEQLTQWINKDPKRKAKYGEALPLIEDYYKSTDASVKGNVYSLEAGLIGADISLYAFRVNRIVGRMMSEGVAAEEIEGLKTALRNQSDTHYKNYDRATDKDVFVQLTKLYKKNITAEQQPAFFKLIDEKYKGSVDAFATKLYATSILTDLSRMEAFLGLNEKKKAKVASKDLGLMVGEQLGNAYFAGQSSDAQSKFDRGYRLFVEALREMQKDKNFYPDANSTMRITYGQVGDYVAADAVQYNYYTTALGILEKEDNTNPEFVVPAKLHELLEEKDYGKWANEKGELPVCFISGNDITGGNSGSPVINGNGELIGLAFDGNWEAMSGDIAFEDELQRTISVDVRYIMFVVDKFAGASNIIDEIDFVKTEDKVNASTMVPVAAD